MADGKLKVYSEEEVLAKIQAEGLDALEPRGRLAAAQVQHRRLADDVDAGQRDRLPLRGGLAPRRPVGHLGQGLGQAQDPLGGRNHRQGLRPGPQDRGGRPLAARAGRPARGDAQQVRADQEVRSSSAINDSRPAAAGGTVPRRASRGGTSEAASERDQVGVAGRRPGRRPGAPRLARRA